MSDFVHSRAGTITDHEFNGNLYLPTICDECQEPFFYHADICGSEWLSARAGVPDARCTLPAGHEGHHEEDKGTSWGRWR